jgi:hypothetical protein
MDNYPDDIAMFNNDPRSPLYEQPPECDECGEELALDVDCDDEGYFVAFSVCQNTNCITNLEEDEYDE